VDDVEARIAGLERRLGSLTCEGTDAGPAADPTERARALNRYDHRWREHLLQGVRGIAPYMAVTLQGTVYFFDPRDTKSSRTLFIEQAVRRDQLHVRRAVEALESRGLSVRGTTFVDVGAHIGTTTIYALRHLGFGKAVAIEPGIENMRLLRLSALGNGIDGSIRTVRAAMSDTVGVAGLDVAGVGSEYHHLSAQADDDLRQLVTTTTLDALVDEGVIVPEEVGLVWMDIEGFEGHALRGGSAVLRHGLPLVMELCPQKLGAAGTLDLLPTLVQEHYTWALDIRKPRDEAAAVPVSALPELIASYDGHCGDVLVWRDTA
jgi:FkbM family methyltransferase